MTLENVRVRYDEKHKKLRIICGAGGPRDPEVVISCEEDRTVLSVFNPLVHDPKAPGLTGWRGVYLTKTGKPKPMYGTPVEEEDLEGICGSRRRSAHGILVCSCNPGHKYRHRSDIRTGGDRYTTIWWTDEEAIDE